MANNQNKSRDVEAILNYSISLESTNTNEKWFLDIISSPDGSKTSNFEDHPVKLTILDLRGRENDAHLDKTGFQFFSSPSELDAETLLRGGHEIKEFYYPEVERLLKKATGADKVVFFDHTIRVNQPKLPEGQDPLHRQPLLRIHVDQTPVSANARVLLHAPECIPYKRCQIINNWRPIGNTVYDYPLALADFRTLDVDEDLVPTEIRYPEWMRDKETYSVKWNPKHVWHYFSQMSPEEVIMLKCYDSQCEKLARLKKSSFPVPMEHIRDVAGLCPHTAFFDPEGAKTGILRQSIEVRALVFHF